MIIVGSKVGVVVVSAEDVVIHPVLVVEVVVVVVVEAVVVVDLALFKGRIFNSYVRMTSVGDVRPYFRQFRIVIL